ncbi:MAG TPA: hypothetical protein VGG65_03585 [Thermoanaerobaculia bacterium]
MTLSGRARLLGVAALCGAVALGLMWMREQRKRASREASRSQWSIGIWEGPSPLRLQPPPGLSNPVLAARDVTDVDAEFVADPFMVQRDSTWYLFFEVLENGTGRGSIGVATSADGRAWRYDRIVLREPFHLSYPFVFREGSDFYMVPESYQAGAVRLYRAVRFPYEWKFETTLLSGLPYVDSSLVKFQDRWFLFTATPENNQLLLYDAGALTGPWTPHPASPIVKRDPHIARPGGRVLVMGDHLLRFAQDDQPSYGHQVIAFEITELDQARYQETRAGEGPVVAASGSGWNRDRMHTVDAHQVAADRWIACVDGKGVLPPK